MYLLGDMAYIEDGKYYIYIYLICISQWCTLIKVSK